jgi:flavin reductase (DIM6/NTAB) family NADH-FMN oxidoreductase RutF
MNELIPVIQFHYLLHPYNTFLVTCCNEQGKPNIITIAWLVPISANPPLVAMSIRPARFSYKLIQSSGEFVINVASYEIAQQVLFCGRRSGSEVDKFAATGLTPGQAQQVHPPIIQECHAHLECRVEKDIEAGDHRLLIARVLAAYARRGVLDQKGLYDLSRVHLLFHLGRDRFTTTADDFIEPAI